MELNTGVRKSRNGRKPLLADLTVVVVGEKLGF